MWLFFVYFALLKGSLGQLYPDNPCPSIFQYARNSWNNDIIGKISVPFDGGQRQFRLTVNASLIGLYQNAKLGIQLLTPKEDILGSNKLDYEVYFPFQDNIPKITQIAFNDNVLCKTTPYDLILPGSGVTNIWSSSVFKMFTIQQTQQQGPFFANQPGNLDYSKNPFLNGLITTKRPLQPAPIRPTQQPIRTTTIRPTIGTTKPSTTTTIRTTPRTTTTQRPKPKATCGTENLGIGDNRFPWVVALMVVSKAADYEYKCTANLISQKHVITAGHCIQFHKVQIVETDDIVLVMGQHDLTRWVTSQAQIRKAKNVYVHPDYTQYSAHGDLALIEFAPLANLDKMLRPICLYKPDFSDVTTGLVTGYGKSQPNQDVTIYRTMSMSMKTEDDCLNYNSTYENVVSRKTFCAQNLDDFGPCVGDVGAGFAQQTADKKWMLRGIVSVVKASDKGTCNAQDYVVFVDLANYTTWIEQMMRS